MLPPHTGLSISIVNELKGKVLFIFFKMYEFCLYVFMCTVFVPDEKRVLDPPKLEL